MPIIHNEPTQEDRDAAIVQCLRIFAARGRQLRLQRERDQAAQREAEREDDGKKMENANPLTPPTPKESECPS